MKSKVSLIKNVVKGKIAVFIDAANIELSAKDKDWRVDYKKLYRWLRDLGKIRYVGFYTVRFDTPRHDAFLTLLKKTGYKLITKPLKFIKDKSNKKGHMRKANFDVEIAVDVVVQKDSFDTLFLFSGDSDFAYLLKELKKIGKIVVVISMKHHIAKELIEKADLYLDLMKIRNIIGRKDK